MIIKQATLQDTSLFGKWDEYVSHHPLGSAYHYSAWLVAVSNVYEQGAIFFYAEDEHGIVGILPAAVIAPPLLPKSICSLPYCDMGHILSDSHAIEKALILHIQNYAHAKGISCIDYRSGLRETPFTQTETAELTGKKVSMKMQLAASSTEQMASYKSKLRSQINKSIKNGCTIKLAQDISLLDDFYAVFSRNMRDLGSPTHKKCWFKQIMLNYQEKVCMGVVYHAGKAIGAGIILCHPTMCSIPWASTIAQYNKLAPNMLLYATLIGYAADSGCSVFDFGRSTLNEGTYRFKKQWGAEAFALDWFELGHAEVNTDIKGTSPARRLVEQIWRKLPLPVSTAVGSSVRGYISL